MDNFNFQSLASYHKNILSVVNHPYGYCITKEFFPENIVKNISSSFKFRPLGFSDPFSKNKKFKMIIIISIRNKKNCHSNSKNF